MKYTHKLPDTTVNVSKKNIPLETLKFLVILAFLGIVFYLLTFYALRFAVAHISPQQEKKLVSLINFTPVMEDEKPNAYLQALTDKLLVCAKLPYAIKTFVLESEERNAFAMPSGKIYITKGMLKEVESENELVAIIGHELGHFKHKDHLKAFGNSLILAFASLFLEDRYGFIFDSSLKLSQAKYSQKAEYDADLFGLDMMACGYGTVSGSTTLFTRMDDGKKWAYFLETHPDFGSRIQKMQAHISEKGYDTKAKITPLKEVF